jgi:GTP-binding protein EngB required for normal cell division
MINKMDKLEAIQEVIADLKGKLRSQATGHIHTAISVLEGEAMSLKTEIRENIEKAVNELAEA